MQHSSSGSGVLMGGGGMFGLGVALALLLACLLAGVSYCLRGRARAKARAALGRPSPGSKLGGKRGGSGDSIINPLRVKQVGKRK